MFEIIGDLVAVGLDLGSAIPVGEYRFLAKVYASLQPPSGSDELLWHRGGAKTLGLVHAHVGNVRVDDAQPTVVIADADTIRRLDEEGLLPDIEDVEHKSADQVIDTIANRLKKRLAGTNGDHPVYESLAETPRQAARSGPHGR